MTLDRAAMVPVFFPPRCVTFNFLASSCLCNFSSLRQQGHETQPVGLCECSSIASNVRLMFLYSQPGDKLKIKIIMKDIKGHARLLTVAMRSFFAVE